MEKAMAPHSSTLAWKIPWAEEPGRLQSMGSHRVRWLRDFTFTFHFHALEKEMATHSSVLAWRIPGMGEPGGLPSMVSHRVGHNWSDLAAATAGKATQILGSNTTSDYKGQIQIMMSPQILWQFQKGDKIAQLLFLPYTSINSSNDTRTGRFNSTDQK